MGADSFLVCYGLRWDVRADDEAAIGLLESRRDPRQLAARQHRLGSWWGKTTDEDRCYLLVGELLGPFGWEGEHSARIEAPELGGLIKNIHSKLLAAGFAGDPAWHFQFEPDR